jgi:hypothetical protein
MSSNRVLTWNLIGVFSVNLALCLTGAAAEIEVGPGEGTISAALSKARSGDVLKLAAGEYRDTLAVPAGITLAGGGPDKTRLTGTGHVLVQLTGPNVTIRGIELLCGADTERGIDSDAAVRIERCRFIKFPHGVALGGAPLADVVCCEFKDCNIGVRSIGKSSPTIWGCRFQGGRQGVFVMDGGPYIRHNLFFELDEGLRVASQDGAIVRNNVFWRCKSHGVLVMPRGEMAILGPSIRNNTFVQCGDAVAGPAEWLAGVSHAVAYESGDPPIRVDAGQPAFDLASHKVSIGDPGLALDEQSTLTVKNKGLTDGQGVRLSDQPASEKGDIGLSKSWTTPGCGVATGIELPPVRFTGAVLIANCIAEEYLALRRAGCDSNGQALRAENGRHIDVLQATCDGQPAEWKFDVDRFFGETEVK